jgi:hypothetical protein
MKIENIIRRVLREEQEEQILKIPGIRYFNNDWNVLQKFLESQDNPKYSIGGNLDLSGSDIETLGNLVRVEGDLDLRRCYNLQSLGDLEYVGGWLDLKNTSIETLGNLVRVEGGLNLMRCFNLQSLGNLEYVGGLFYLYGNENLQSLGNLVRVGSDLDLGSTRIETLGNLEYVGGDLVLISTPLSKKYTEEQIRNMIEVVGEIYM